MKKLTKEQIEGVFEWMSNCEPLKHTDAATGFLKYYTNKIAQAEATDKDSGMALEDIKRMIKPIFLVGLPQTTSIKGIDALQKKLERQHEAKND